MKVNLIGCGCGSLTTQAQAAIARSGLLVGSGRMLRDLAAAKNAAEAVTPEAIAHAIKTAECGEVSVLFSGDSGFYSGARILLPMLGNCEIEVFPGISSLQHFAAAIRRPWQDWNLYSAHGTECDVVGAVCRGKPAFFLTGGKLGPAELCQTLTEAGLGELQVTVGEDLGTPGERVTVTCAGRLAEHSVSPLSVLLCEAAPRPSRRTGGLPDEVFERADRIPMTKQLVRAAILAKLAVEPDDLCWDIGSGTGSVSIEMALQARAVYGVENNPAALELAERNRKKHGAWNLRLVGGTAPEVLAGLPAPDKVFIGGSGGRLREILDAVKRANPSARICISAIALETAAEGLAELKEKGYRTEMSQLSVCSGKEAGDLTLMLAQNPVWLIVGSSI